VVYDTDTLAPMQRLSTGNLALVIALAYSPDGKRLAAASAMHGSAICESANGQCVVLGPDDAQHLQSGLFCNSAG
jgi:hypothetical protein